MKKYTFFLLLFLSLFSCKKEKLTGEKEIFIGKWKWIYSVYNDSSPDFVRVDSVTPENNFELEFTDKSKVFIYENNKLCAEKDVIMSNFFICDINLVRDSSVYIHNSYIYFIETEKKNKTNNTLRGLINEDTLIVTFDMFTFDYSIAGYKNYNFFVREK